MAFTLSAAEVETTSPSCSVSFASIGAIVSPMDAIFERWDLSLVASRYFQSFSTDRGG